MKQTDILFLNPITGNEPAMTPPWGMLFVLAYAREKRPNISFTFHDFNTYKPSLFDQHNVLANYKPKIIGMYTTTNFLNVCLEMAVEIKKILPKTLIILGGHHVTARPKDLYLNIDSIVAGEGELPFMELLDDYLTKGKIKKNYKAKLNLANIDFLPAWDQVNPLEYHPEWGSYFKYYPQAWITAGRGCPFDCYFCGSVVYRDCKPRNRRRSPQNVLSEIEFLINKYDIRSFFFTDDEININIKWLDELCKLMISRNLKIRWAAQFRANPPLLPETLFEVMKESGCRAAGIGIESGNDEVLMKIRKKTTVSDNIRAMKLFKEHKIIVHGCFMIGNVWATADGNPDGESFDQIQQTRYFVKNLINEGLLNSMSCSIASPLPGAPMEKVLREHHFLKYDDYSQWNKRTILREELSFSHPRLTELEIYKTFEAIWRESVFNSRIILRRLIMIRSIADAMDFVRNGLYVLKKVTKNLVSFFKFKHNQ